MMTDFIRELYTPKLMPDEQIQEILNEYLQLTEASVVKMELSWDKTPTEYILEIVLDIESEVSCETYTSTQHMQQRIIVGSVFAEERGELSALITSGRRLFFRLKKEFPLLERKLGMYKYFKTKDF